MMCCFVKVAVAVVLVVLLLTGAAAKPLTSHDTAVDPDTQVQIRAYAAIGIGKQADVPAFCDYDTLMSHTELSPLVNLVNPYKHVTISTSNTLVDSVNRSECEYKDKEGRFLAKKVVEALADVSQSIYTGAIASAKDYIEQYTAKYTCASSELQKVVLSIGVWLMRANRAYHALSLPASIRSVLALCEQRAKELHDFYDYYRNEQVNGAKPQLKSIYEISGTWHNMYGYLSDLGSADATMDAATLAKQLHLRRRTRQPPGPCAGLAFHELLTESKALLRALARLATWVDRFRMAARQSDAGGADRLLRAASLVTFLTRNATFEYAGSRRFAAALRDSLPWYSDNTLAASLHCHASRPRQNHNLLPMQNIIQMELANFELASTRVVELEKLQDEIAALLDAKTRQRMGVCWKHLGAVFDSMTRNSLIPRETHFGGAQYCCQESADAAAAAPLIKMRNSLQRSYWYLLANAIHNSEKQPSDALIQRMLQQGVLSGVFKGVS